VSGEEFVKNAASPAMGQDDVELGNAFQKGADIRAF
jgi:hypothetical protein